MRLSWLREEGQGSLGPVPLLCSCCFSPPPGGVTAWIVGLACHTVSWDTPSPNPGNRERREESNFLHAAEKGN